MMMVITMNDSNLNSMVQIESFLSETEAIEFKKKFRKEAYRWIEETLGRFHYFILSKKEKGLIRRYLREYEQKKKELLNNPEGEDNALFIEDICSKPNYILLCEKREN